MEILCNDLILYQDYVFNHLSRSLNSFKKMLDLFSITKIPVNVPTLPINHFVVESRDSIDEMGVFVFTIEFTFSVFIYKTWHINRNVGWLSLIVQPFNVNFACDIYSENKLDIEMRETEKTIIIKYEKELVLFISVNGHHSDAIDFLQ